ncbi:MAG: AMP-binding protein [Prevotellaceae bacterium]|jgi:phenylacetate-CoA ligase|nr:AMP-binding protein [Prevotellaceae bacterium]
MNEATKYFNLDFQDETTVKEYQNSKLTELLQYLQEKSGFYRNLFKINNIGIHKIKNVNDLKYIPPSTKRDIQLYNWDFLCVPKDRIVEYTATSGTLGAPVVIALSNNDLNRLSYNEWLSFGKMNLRNDDVIQLVLTLDKQFMAGMAYYQGSRMLGATVIRTGPGAPSMQWDTIFRMETTTIVAVPSFIIKLLEYAELNDIKYRESPVKRILCIGENIRNTNMELNLIGQRIKNKWDVDLYSTYASTEMQTAFTECGEGAGGHQHCELIIAEILDDYGNRVAEGETGELVITTLGVEAMPLLRYRTGDLCFMTNEPCACGRKSPRISPIVGRKNHMVKLKGTTLYPPMIFEILNIREEIEDYVVEVSSNSLGTDNLTIHIVMKKETDANIKTIESYLHASLRVRPEIKITDLATLRNMQMSETSRKVAKFLDKRP